MVDPIFPWTLPGLRRLLAWPLLLALAGLVAGCGGAQGVRGEFRLQLDETAVRNPVMWPTPPEVPRYMYAGELIGERNFVDTSEGVERGAKNVFNWLVGLFEEQPEEVTLQRPQAGVVDASGRVLVTDTSRNAVYVFDEAQSELQIWEFADGLQRFRGPIGIALGRNGEVLVSDAELGHVVRLDSTGKPVGAIGKGLFKRPTGLARDPVRGLVYVADTHAHDVKVFDDDGNLVKIIGYRGDGEGQFNYPTHLAFARGELYVTDTMNNRVQVFNGDGELVERAFGRRGLYVGQMVRPKGVAVDDEGNVYVVEGYYDHLLVYNGAGEFLLGIGGTGAGTGKFFLPAGTWIDSHNRVFVADMFNGRVAVFQFLGGQDG